MMSNHNDIMCEVEIDSNIVEVVDNEAFGDMGVVYDYEVRVGDDDQYEEVVTCENDDSQGLLLQNIDDGEYTSLLHFPSESIYKYIWMSSILIERIRLYMNGPIF